MRITRAFGLPVHRLPSTSPANASWSFERKLSAWRAVFEEAGLLTPEWQALAGKIVENLTDVGATGSAALPIALDDAWKTGAIKDGDLVMLLAIETSKWKYAGMVLPWTAGPCPT